MKFVHILKRQIFLKLNYINLQFYCDFFLLFFLGMRPGFKEKKFNKYTGLLNLLNTELNFLNDKLRLINLNFHDKGKKKAK